MKNKKDKKKRQNNHFFSLIELLIVIAIIGSVSTIIGIKISQATASYKYTRTTSSILQKLKLAKQLALANQCDTHVILQQENSRIICSIIFPGGGACEPEAKFHHLFSQIYFIFTNKDNSPSPNPLVITFTSGGDVLPKGTLRLCPVQKLKGFPEHEIAIDFSKYFSREEVKEK